MSYEPAALSTALAAAVGDDHALVNELRHAFMDSAARHMDALRRSETEGEWRESALRLKGLAASFGASSLMDLADSAADSGRGDPDTIGALQRSLTILSL